ncbi:TonB-dependent receptor [Caballeronia sordidicola]|uniref:TonB-dependent receptor n=1 Tax=Caballeronia sordidicola TaxID=196367 RepID=A0A158GRR0_CABSO|nr:TonB-dependent receptor [Caballeronia sordidicola]SAL34755.1 TonB-dependent receptor [Caballeronia sordidicola]
MKKIDVRRFGKKASAGLAGSLVALTLAHPAAAQETPPSGNKTGNAVEAPTLPPVQVRATSGLAQNDNVNDPSQITGVSKTGTALKDLPASVQVIPRALLTEQGATMLRQGVSNASGVNVGGQDTKGYYDHFLVRGLNAQIYNDGFSDGDLLGGISHSLNGVERIEVLEGPGSALFGSGPPGGTINIVHYAPSSDFHFGGNVQSGSFGTIGGSGYVTGPTGISGLNYRVDATVSRSDGFRDLASRDEEIRPAFEWKLDNHKIDFSIDARDIHETPDSYGLIYFNGSPITGVSRDAKYSTPFAFARGNYVRPTLTDEWKVNDFLTINNRFSYLHRSLDVLGNGDSTSTKVSGNQVVGRQLRQQDDSDNSIDYQLEPVWRFATGSVKHTLLTGFEYQHQTIDTERSTADLPNIPNAFAPVPPETSLAGLTFLCDAKHSCDNDHLLANYYSVYATDQIDVTDKLKIRAGVRKDWWDTSLTPNITVPGRFDTQGDPLVAGMTNTRNDAPVSWNVGVLYKVLPWMSPYFGISKSHLANFNSENTQNGIGAPESALQYEAGIKFSFLDDRYVLNTALFDVKRDNVASLTTINNIESVVFDSQRTKGAEASLDASLTSQWHVIANFTAQQAKITDNPQGITSVGNHPQGAPAYIANLWTTYNFSIAGVPGFHVGAGVNYVSKTYSDITNVNSIPSYVIANAAIGYEAPKWGIDLNVHNLTDRRYFVAANAAGAYEGESLSAFVNVHANF